MQIRPDAAVDVDVARWAASGLMALSGTTALALGPPAALVRGVDRLGTRFAGLDPLTLLGERAALLGLARGGTTSCGGGCHLLAAADGWIALSLARPEDFAALPAWLGRPMPEATAAAWTHVAQEVTARSCAQLVERGALLDLPVAALDHPPDRAAAIDPVSFGSAPPRADPRGLLVVDLTALWAGPLCGDLLSRAGAEVVKVESNSRPDGARRGPAEFFDLLNGHKQSVALDFRRRADIGQLRTLLNRADIVLESSRPRALAQLGLGADEVMGHGGPRLWVSITGYGRDGAASNRVAFGDDAAAAAGLVVYERGEPRFCGDAIADPLTGLAAADACLGALAGGGRWLLDVSMAAVAATLVGPTLAVPAGTTTAPPTARPITARASALGADTRRVFERFGVHADVQVGAAP